MGMFDIFKKKKETVQGGNGQAWPTGRYLDKSYVKDLHHVSQGPWHQYDILIDARGYGWETMVDWADYMAQKDLIRVDQLSVGDLHADELDLTKEFQVVHNCKDLLKLKEEHGNLGIAGPSKVFGGAPMKIVWFNQTQVLRLFTMFDDENAIKRYAETVIRRTFGTPDQMKLGL